MKIGIVTFCNCDNYGAELQAFAMQYIYRKAGYDAEIIDLQMNNRSKNSAAFVIPALVNRFRIYGWRAPIEIIKLILDVRKRKQAEVKYADKIRKKHQLFVDFFNQKVKHSSKHYQLDDMYTADMDYDAYVAGSDQIWNWMHTKRLDVYFLEFANRFKARKISYAASVSAKTIPSKYKDTYKRLLENLDAVSVREIQAKEQLAEISEKEVEVVLDPTLLITKEEWKDAMPCKKHDSGKYVLIYTLSGSKYIYDLAKSIANRIDNNCKVFNVKSDFQEKNTIGINHLTNVGPKEWVELIMNASYVVTDSFHGTAFSINFNKPFTTLLNPSSNMNNRALSILTITGLEKRLIYDDGSNKIPEDLSIDFLPVNTIINEWREKSWRFIKTSLA